MISKFDLSALGTESYKPIRPTHLRNEKESSDDKEKDDKELNRYVLSRMICELLNDYSDGPDFVEDDHNFGSLKSLTEDDWSDILKKIEKKLKDEYNTDIEIDVEYDWTKKDGREVKDFVDKVWKLIDSDDSSDGDDSDKGSEEEQSSEERYILRNSKSKDDDDDSDEEDEDLDLDEEEDDSDDKSEDEDPDDDDSEDSDKDDDDESDSDKDEDEEDDDKEDSKSEDKEDDDEESDDEDEEEDDDKSDKKSKSKKDEDGDDEEEDDEDDKDDKSEKSEEILRVCASKYPLTPWDSDALYQDLHKLEVYHNYVRSLDVTSNEGIGTGLLKIFIGVTDTFLRIGNTFKTNIFKFYKDLKRSEMRYYYESHTTMCLKAESIPITQVTNLDVPIPSGMKGTYQSACMSLEQVYTVLDIQSYGQGVLAALIDFRRKLMRSEDYKNTLVPMTNLVKQRETSLNSLKTSVDKVFTEQKTPMNVKFMDVYKTMKEFKDTRLSLLDMEKYLAATNKLVKLVDDIDTVLADITSYLTEDQEIDKALVTDMINIVKYMGVSFDIYGTTTTRQMAVEHNHIGVIGKVWSTIN